jgi:hypothetical protein
MTNQTAEKALAAVKKAGAKDRLASSSSAFICPFSDCRALSQHHWGMVETLRVRVGGVGAARKPSDKQDIILALCTSCDRESVFVDGRLVAPISSDAPPPNPDMPSAVMADFEEAREIYRRSPRGAAALLRLIIQKLCPILGATAKDINTAIGELVQKGVISAPLQQALDTVRVIGNEAVHPGTMDIKDDVVTARSLFDLVNFVVEKGLSEPKKIAAIYQALPPGKLAGIQQRDKA